MAKSKVNVAIIGLGCGTQFTPIYKRHPQVNMHAICRRSEKELHDIGDIFGVERRYTKYAEVLADPAVDFVHINTPIPDHGPMSIAALEAGKHVMCTVLHFLKNGLSFPVWFSDCLMSWSSSPFVP